jgi:hypothetical protein
MTRVIEDVNSVERVLIDGTEQGTVAILSIVGVLVILFVTNLSWPPSPGPHPDSLLGAPSGTPSPRTAVIALNVAPPAP